ncbi:hypothetical protein TW65_00380 [Stemphylium lycopersici]|uniref:Uncharacterized protein n=1 Tax=Stemphylium lycopersici TaxID=183478 RepID=A0A364N904_STELY|nr:hypothetical protein TW65_00380 [Stemphylium lycopersici]RAR13687.1 hypothetical protein DDE83_002872 [Stemphylium lycopersici]
MPSYTPTIPLQPHQLAPLHHGPKAYLLNTHPRLYTLLRTISTTTPHPSLLSHPIAAIYPWPLDAILLPKRRPNETPLDRIYVMYHYIVRGEYAVLRNEVQDFWDYSRWKVERIPDPRDADAERYAVLAAVVVYLALGMNRRRRVEGLSRRGRRSPRARGQGGAWAGFKEEVEHAAWNFFCGTRGLPCSEALDSVPKWAGRVKPVTTGLVLGNGWESGVWGERRSTVFAGKGIVAEEIVECFI